MTNLPETRETLIQRLPNAADAEAWDTFVQIYEPLLYRMARARGLQQADAEDLVQEVLTAVSKSIERWLASGERGRFRAWLFRIASNLSVNFLTRPKHQRLGSGDSAIARLLDEQPVPPSGSAELFLKEYRREIFRWAAEHVREQVSQAQWRVFWLTSVENRPIAAVAHEFGMSVGSVYIARSRVTKRIRDMIQKHEEQTQ